MSPEHEQMVHEFLRRRQEFLRQKQRPRPKPFPQPDMEAWIRADVAIVHRASREIGISEENDERRARYAGKLGVVAKVDPADQSVKVRVMVSPGRADEVWYGRDAVWDPRLLAPDLEVQVSPEIDVLHATSRAAGIDSDNDERRGRGAGKLGTVLKVDAADGSAKVRVMVRPGRADDLWFGIGGIAPRIKQS